MSKKILWWVVGGLMALSLVTAACGPAAVEEKKPAPVVEEKKAPVVEEKKQEVVEKEVVKPTAETPKYGGTLNLVASGDAREFATLGTGSGCWCIDLSNQGLWAGDWTKGPAGGYGTGETDWLDLNDLWHLKTGYIAESVKWTTDYAKDEGTLIYQIRQGIHWVINPAPHAEASRRVGGRELTADDVVFQLNKVITTTTAYIYTENPGLKNAKITKSGPREVSVKVPKLSDLPDAIMRLSDSVEIVAPEVWQTYGGQSNWKNVVSNGPFMIAEYVPGSQLIFTRNPNYWGKDPIGPGKGNQLPYLDTVRYLIIPDASTRQAALRTGKIDMMADLTWEDAPRMRKQVPALLEKYSPPNGGQSVQMRGDRPPLNDIRVRKAVLMATDMEAIRQNVYNGLGDLVAYPFGHPKGYEDLYLDLDAPDFPAEAKENFVYNPEKARQLLKEAGYPNGFKAKALATSTEVDMYSIYKDMWSKVGIDLTIEVRDSAAKTDLQRRREHPEFSTWGWNPFPIFYIPPTLTAGGASNVAMINDPVIEEWVPKVKLALLGPGGMKEAMRLMREHVSKQVIRQAYNLPRQQAGSYIFWWPWLKNYSGEQEIGYRSKYWPMFIWLDQTLKKSMGY